MAIARRTSRSAVEQAKVMNRYDITKRLVDLLHQDEAVIGGIGYTNFDLWAASASPHGRRQQNFYMLGSMGLAVPIALGVALAQPGRKVFALEGDGSILMQLGSLSTVAARQQQQSVHRDHGQRRVSDHRRPENHDGSRRGHRRHRQASRPARRVPGRRTRPRSWS